MPISVVLWEINLKINPPHSDDTANKILMLYCQQIIKTIELPQNSTSHKDTRSDGFDGFYLVETPDDVVKSKSYLLC